MIDLRAAAVKARQPKTFGVQNANFWLLFHPAGLMFSLGHQTAVFNAVFAENRAARFRQKQKILQFSCQQGVEFGAPGFHGVGVVCFRYGQGGVLCLFGGFNRLFEF